MHTLFARWGLRLSSLALILGPGIFAQTAAEVSETDKPPATPAVEAAPLPENTPGVTESDPPSAYVIPIDGPIDSNRLYILKNGWKRAEELGADLIILDMDTPGGAVVITQEIVDLITRSDVPTFTFVRQWAFSAGAIIALATDHIYMKEGSVIGDAMPVLQGQEGFVDMDDANREKLVAGIDAMVRAIAERKGRDVMLARCMVRRELEYEIDGVVICKAGELLAMTNREAERTFGDPPKPLLSEGTADSIEAMLERAGYPDAKLITHESGAAETLAHWLGVLSPLLLMLFMLGFYIEANTPGFGVGGIIALVAISLFFLGQHAAGLAGHEEIALVALGVVLILIELFVTPGFGVLGITGLFMVLGGLLAAMMPFSPGFGDSDTPQVVPALTGLGQALRVLMGSIIGSGLLILLIMRILPSRAVARSPLVLRTNLDRSQGYVAGTARSETVGQTGRTLSRMAPWGKILFQERPIDARSRGEFIEAEREVRVVAVEGSTLVVEEYTPPEERPS